MESSRALVDKNEKELRVREKSEELKEIVLEGGPDWRDRFTDVVESLDDNILELTLARFIEEVVRSKLYNFEDFVAIYEVTSTIWHNRSIYLPWVEVVSKYGTEAMFQIMDEDANSNELWFVFLALGQAYAISSERLAKVIEWMEENGHDLDEILDDYVDQLNRGSIRDTDYDIAVILALCTHLQLDIASQPWATDGGKVAQKIRPLLEGV